MDAVQTLLNGVEGEELEKELNVELQSTENIDVDVNDSMSVNELKQICKEKGLSVSGNKGKLISRIKKKINKKNIYIIINGKVPDNYNQDFQQECLMGVM